MKNKLFIIIGLFFFIAIATAGTLITIDKVDWTDTVTLTQAESTLIKTKSNVETISVSTSKITCDEKTCWAEVKQYNVINDIWRRDVDYCSKKSVCVLDMKNPTPCIEECIERTDYTDEENTQAVKDFVNERLKDYASAEEKRTTVTLTSDDKIGRVTE